MTIKDCNDIICEFLGFKLKNDSKTWEIIDKDFQKIFNLKTSSLIDFSNNSSALELLRQRICIIKDVNLAIQFINGECSVFISVGGTQNEYSGEFERFTFSCERHKPLNKYTSALFEVFSTFCGFCLKDTKFRSDICWELARVGNQEEDSNIQYMEPIEVKTHCPICGEEISIMFNDLKPLQVKDLDK